MRRACAVPGCLLLGDGVSRCPQHQGILDAKRKSRHKGRRAEVPGDGAARRARAMLNKQGHGSCAKCGAMLPASGLEVDHRVPLLANRGGGEDVAQNLQLLCRPCHLVKTAEEQRTHPPPRKT